MPSTLKEPVRKTKRKSRETTVQGDRKKRILTTLNYGLDERRAFEGRIRRSLLLYSGQSPDKDKPNRVRYVSPLAYIFVEAKTAEEVRAMSEFAITPVEDAGDAWKIPFLEDLTDHVESKVNWPSKRIQMLRMKNIAGVSIARVGYRNIMGKRKVGKKYDNQGRMIGWDEIDVPVYDDLFLDIVPPLDFVIDPNATTISEAMWCGHFHAEHIDNFREMYGNDGRFSDVESVKAGDMDMVGMYEQFNHVLDEWITFAFPLSMNSPKAATDRMKMMSKWTEIGALPLPDDHKKLPFFEYQNESSFADDPVADAGVYKTEDGEYTSAPYNVRDRETFWKEGVPSKIEDLIDLHTDFGRSAFRALDLAGQVIYLTANNYSLDEAIPWRSGMQAIGGLNKVKPINLGAGINIASFEVVFRKVFEECVMATGIDPRNLTDTKVKTLGEAEIQNETAARRLALGITYNEENGELQRGWLMVKDEQQYYSEKEVVRLTGRELTKDLDKDGFTDIKFMGAGKNKKPVTAKRFRRIRSSKKLMDKSKEGKLFVSESDFGVNSFLARPEIIRTSEIDIRVIPKRRVDQSNAVQLKQYDAYLQRLTPLLEIASVSQTEGGTVIDTEDIIKNIKVIMDGYAEILGLDKKRSDADDEGEEMKQLLAARDRANAPVSQ